MLKKIIFGGQTGAGRGAADAALATGLETGGYAPLGWKTENGSEPDLGQTYGLVEASTESYAERRRLNIEMADGVALFGDMDRPGHQQSIAICEELQKTCIQNPIVSELGAWLEANSIETLCIGNAQESNNPGIYQRVYDLFSELLAPSN